MRRRRPEDRQDAAAAVRAPKSSSACCPPASTSKPCSWAVTASPACSHPLPKGALVIDSSTIAAATSQKVAKAAEAAGITFIDAPVSGGTGGAIAGTLTFMVGGDTAALERARPCSKKWAPTSSTQAA